MADDEMVIFTRSFDFLAWLLVVTRDLPRHVRHSYTQRLLDAAFDLRERLEEAQMRRGTHRRERLARADEALARTRMYLRLGARLEWFTAGQYQHGATLLIEIGRLLGGWQKA